MVQQYMTSLLAETNFNIYENFMLPKCSIFIMLTFTHDEENTALHGYDPKWLDPN